jgi:tetratricopeptide (TPR) repeat protein
MGSTELDTLSLLGYVFLMTDKLEKALSVFAGLAELYPDHAHNHRLLAYTYLRLQRYAEALPETEAALAAAATDDEARDKLLLMKAHALWGLDRKDEADRLVEDFFAARATRRGGAR